MSNTIKEIFEKPVDRQIDGVIKADDTASLRVELDEYVLTKEIETNLGKFLSAYNNYSVANGVWISGFFGSGKSHLLKMLALVLENAEVDGRTPLSFFEDKLADNPMALADLKKAVAIPSQSILFNIDQKADVISKRQGDAVLSVFQKVFDEMCGYYGKVPHIAQLERDLDRNGQLEAFREAFADIAGKPWDEGREEGVLQAPKISQAYAKIAGLPVEEAKGLLANYRSDHSVSIEDFANQVKAYIDTKDAGFRLNFFIDEVGQYIADNVKLMTNLQTIAESLNTKCKGQAWIVVTAQQAMDQIVGDMTSQEEHDFSKIQARFANRMPLNSQDVAEVIQRRLLAKTPAGKSALVALYEAEKNNLRTLFEFTDGSRTFKSFRDGEHFAASYPFVQYQYDLFQSAIQQLSTHNAFEGRHSSVGERSMLGVFQEVAKAINGLEVGTLASFDRMFEGIRSALKSSVQHSIHAAENNISDEFTLRVLKALFLVKYVREFKPTIHNVSILMTERLDQDQKVLRKKVEDALQKLEQDSYIQRNGDLYEFLTNEEKDVEDEIKATSIDEVEIRKTIDELVFDYVVRKRKIRHATIDHDYAYSRKVDGYIQNRDYELSINVITPFHEHSGNEEHFRSGSIGQDELYVVLPADRRLMEDVKMLLRTDKYVRQSNNSGQPDSIQSIIRDRGEKNAQRRNDVITRLGTLLRDARFFALGDEIEPAGQEAAGRVIGAFQTLIDRVYPNLVMLKGVQYSEGRLQTYLEEAKSGLFGSGGAAGLTEAEQAVFDAIMRMNNKGMRATIKSITEAFEKKPYGWPLSAIQAQLATLFGRGKIEAKADSNMLNDAGFIEALKNTAKHSNVILEPQVDFTPAQVRALTEFYKDYFDSVAPTGDPKALALKTADLLKEEAHALQALQAQVLNYRFLSKLDPVIADLKDVSDKPYKWFLLSLSEKSDALLDAKEDVVAPIRKFMDGPQKGIFDDARKFLSDETNNLIGDLAADAVAIRTVLDDPAVYRGDAVQGLKASVDALRTKIRSAVDEVRKESVGKIQVLKSRVEGDEKLSKLPEAAQANLLNAFDAAMSEIRAGKVVPIIRDIVRRFEDEEYPRLIGQLAAAGSETEPVPAAGDGAGTTAPGVSEPRIVPVRHVRVPHAQALLDTEGDVDAYVDALRDALKAEIRSGKKVSV